MTSQTNKKVILSNERKLWKAIAETDYANILAKEKYIADYENYMVGALFGPPQSGKSKTSIMTHLGVHLNHNRVALHIVPRMAHVADYFEAIENFNQNVWLKVAKKEGLKVRSITGICLNSLGYDDKKHVIDKKGINELLDVNHHPGDITILIGIQHSVQIEKFMHLAVYKFNESISMKEPSMRVVSIIWDESHKTS